MKKLILIFFSLIVLSACSQKKEKYSKTFYETFDTQILYTEYANNQKDFDKNFKLVKDEFTRLHKLYDNFREYKNVNNIYTINKNSGKKAVKVDKDLFNLIKFSLENYEKSLEKTNFAMGKVLKIWYDTKQKNSGLDENKTKIPSNSELVEANKKTDIKSIVLDEKNMTVFIKKEGMLLDFGAIAKGYATQLIADKLEKRGVKNASINAGGNVRTIGTPGDGRETWAIALQNPDLDNKEFLDILYINGSNSIVTSGNYQRFFMHKGKKYHHIINPKTLWPDNKYVSITVVTKDSGLADMLSTAFFLSSKEEANNILKNYKDIDIAVLWVDSKGNITFTDNMKDLMNKKN